MLLLEQDITKKKQIDKKITKLEFEIDNNKEYRQEII